MNGEPHENGPPSDAFAELCAYMDGESSEAERGACVELLARDASARERLRAWQAQKAALQALCATPGESTPPIVVRTRPPWRHRAALAACWLVAGAGLGFAAHDIATPYFGAGVQASALARRADLAYAVYAPEERHPVEVPAADRAHLIAWLSKRLDRPLSVPSLDEYGYRLVGGRLLPGEGGPAAQFMYEAAGGTRVTLYVTRATHDESDFKVLRAGTRSTFYWVNDRMGYAMSSSIPELKLRAIATDVCASLGGRPQRWQ